MLFLLFFPSVTFGESVAAFEKGVIAYQSGEYEKAVKWFTLSAKRGVASAQSNLGVMYKHGQGVTQDYKQAVKWFRLAAEQGVAISQYELGLFFQNGKGVIQDYKQAVKWLKLAAEQGHADAQFSLSGHYYGSTLNDIVYAHMWSNIASSNNAESALTFRDVIAKEMSKEQIAEAQKLARECVAKDYKGC